MTTAIEIEGLVKHYDARAAMQGVSFSVEAGESFGYPGPNGTGKLFVRRDLTH